MHSLNFANSAAFTHLYYPKVDLKRLKWNGSSHVWITLMEVGAARGICSCETSCHLGSVTFTPSILSGHLFSFAIRTGHPSHCLYWGEKSTWNNLVMLQSLELFNCCSVINQNQCSVGQHKNHLFGSWVVHLGCALQRGSSVLSWIHSLGSCLPGDVWYRLGLVIIALIHISLILLLGPVN